jgi:predicted AAA+ superfamily ATPase
MIPREAARTLRRLSTQYPVVTVTGPRQSGKTTLCRSEFPELDYVNLERPDVRERAGADPVGFLNRLDGSVILDEIQRLPDLLSYLQVAVDEDDTPGQFVLTGSHQFSLSEAISQSLAGRTGLVRLLPFTVSEAEAADPGMTIDDMLFRGFYPRIYDHGLDPVQALGDYAETYVERDVRRIAEIRNLATFRRFLRLCAGRVGQLVNMNGLANDVGVSQPTINHWMTILEASFVVFRLPPFHANLGKRLIKSPKLYFCDVGFASHLIGIQEPAQLVTHPLRGALFENLVVLEVLKHRFNAGRRSNLSFYRDSSGLEVDLMLEDGAHLTLIEAKSGETVTPALVRNLDRLGALFGDRVERKLLVTGSREEGAMLGAAFLPARRLASVLDEHGT